MNEVWNLIREWNAVTVLLFMIFVLSVLQGMYRGASSSARRLLLLALESAATVVSLFIGWQLTSWLSPKVQLWLAELGITIPAEELGFWQQLYYTAMTGMRDFSLLRFSVLFVLSFGIIKQLVYRVMDPLIGESVMERTEHASAQAKAKGETPTILSSLAGGAIGIVTGAARSLIFIAILFVVTTLFPYTQATGYIQASSLYQKGAKEIIEPVTGDFLTSQLPVFTRAVEEEFANILQRKYEVVDARIPADIKAAAEQITAKGSTDEEKAKLLYRYVGTRVKYDWDKVKLYEEKRIWKEQTPEETFLTKQGVCIDFSRLYAVMARSIGLEVKVVTGLGYDGRGSYGPHAWNEVYLSEKKAWVPLDSTWVASGGNWFNPPNFHETHIKEV
ncbi:transglutaminase domain-containing protein [Paenibacillus silviterrae]|uniref:transglutaminase domain-containing protein n=1 Tax=Paenibacillus silviterrae TaxID=3242194 RepID=UPI0035581CAB